MTGGTGAVRSLKEYLDELDRSKSEREDQVREGLEIYVELWRKAIQRKVVSEEDTVEAALEKVEERGGLYKVAED